MPRSMLVLATLAGAFLYLSSGPIRAADLPLAAGVERGPDCGPCGCLSVEYVHHRELLSTYGTGFDPRNYDETEPHYYFGPVRSYPRYFVNGLPAPGNCY